MSVAYRSTCRPTVGQQLSVDISTDISVECRSRYRPISRLICRLICRPTHLDRYIGRVSVDLSTAISVDMSSDTRPICLPIYRSRGAQNTHDPNLFSKNYFTMLRQRSFRLPSVAQKCICLSGTVIFHETRRNFVRE